MKYEPLVSIIIPVYNGSDYMAQAIDSALAQTYKNIEVIVVNDGSTDGGKTESIALSYGERIRYIYKQNGGTATALNCGIDNMRGEYASWLSHDDLYLPQKVEKQVEFLNRIIEKYGEEEGHNCLIFSPIEAIDSEGKVILRKKGLNRERWEPEFVFKNMNRYAVCGCATLIPKAVFERIGKFDPSKKTVQDNDFWYRIPLSGINAYRLDEYLVQNRRHKGQTSNMLKGEWSKEIVSFESELIDRIVSRPELNRPEVLSGVAKYYFVRGSKENRAKIHDRLIASGEPPFRARIKECAWTAKRTARTAARSVYRKLLAK